MPASVSPSVRPPRLAVTARPVPTFLPASKVPLVAVPETVTASVSNRPLRVAVPVRVAASVAV